VEPYITSCRCTPPRPYRPAATRPHALPFTFSFGCAEPFLNVCDASDISQKHQKAMFSSKYLLAFVLVVTGLSVFSVPTGANALVLPSHAHARRAASLLATRGRRATRALKRRLPVDADTHTLARRRVVPAPSPASEDDDDEETRADPSSSKKSSGTASSNPSADGTSAPGNGPIDNVIESTGNAIKGVGHATTAVLMKSGEVAADTARGAGSMLMAGVNGAKDLTNESIEGIKNAISPHSMVHE
jgi:hypothetical protein